MEIVRNSLDFLMKHHKKEGKRSLIPVDETLTLLMFIAEGLHYIHKKGIVHRFLSPKNIMITHQNEIKILGLDTSLLSELIEETIHFETDVYTAPELLNNGEVFSLAVDVFSLSIIAYRILSGELFGRWLYLSVINVTINKPSYFR